MFGCSGEATSRGTQGVAGHALVRCKALQQRCGDANVNAGADQAVRHAVVVATELDVVVNVDLGRLPATDDEALRRQRPQRGCIQLLEGAASAAW